jgi:tetratricopeptide (TPR) repeat protein
MASAPATAAVRIASDDPELTYLQARAAAMDGDHARAATLLAGLAQAQPGQADLARKALSEAIAAGQMDLALQLAQRTPAARLTSDARLLLAAGELRRGRDDRAVAWLAPAGASGGLDFLAPLVRAWASADSGDMAGALRVLSAMPANSPLAPMSDEQRAFILLKFRRTADAAPIAEQAAASAGARESRLRLAYADGFVAAGDQAHALAIVQGMGAGTLSAREQIRDRKRNGSVIDSGAKAFSETLIAFAAEVAKLQHAAPPLGLVQVARYADPRNSSTTILLAQVFENDDRPEPALAALRAIPDDDPLAPRARDVQVRILANEKRYADAYALAEPLAVRPDATIDDFTRLGDVYGAMKRQNDAANAYGRAVALAQTQGLKDELWPLLLVQAGSLEEAKRWPEAQSAVQQALKIAPEQPLLLNFLGYTELVRGQNVEAAEAMIRKASELAPDDASITDSLGWAEFKRGKVSDAIATLQRAAEKDPEQAEIQEHLGDALFSNGDHLEARFAWNAALVTANDDVAARIKAKLASGLAPGNAAP